MKRRDFVRASGAASLAAAFPLRLGLRRAAPAPSVEEIEDASIAELVEWMERGRFNARTIVERYFERIGGLDRLGPELNALLETNPDALALADERDAERRAGRLRGPLHGVPILLKDNIDTADRMTTTAGSLALEGSIPRRDARVAERLRGAGAILLGKTNLSEWANFRSTRSSSGWSARGGQVRNPYALDRTPCGSSSGSGVAVAASFAPAAIGTETDGSIVCPSSANSLVGLKPTVGLVSRAGIVPIAHSQDTAGPMTRTVRDAAFLLGVMAGADPRDPATRARPPVDYLAALVEGGLRGARLGVDRERYFGYSEETDGLIDAALDVLKQEGAVLVEVALPTVRQLGDPEFEVLLFEFKADLDAYLRGLGPGARPHSLRELIAFNERERQREMPFFRQEIFEMAVKKGPLTSPAYRKARTRCRELSRTRGIDAVVQAHRLDAIVAPTSGPPWPIDLVNGDPSGGGGASTMPAVAGYPHVTVPAGYVYGLPVGLSFFGPAYAEAALLKLAYAYEQATRHRQAPRFLQSAELPHQPRG